MHQIQHTFTLSIEGDTNLYRSVRAAFIAKGTSLNAWCTENGVNRQTAEKALKGARAGKISRQLVQLLVQAAFDDA